MFVKRIAQKRGRKVALTALSTKPATLLWEVLTRKEPCRYGRATTISTKVARARRRAHKACLPRRST